MKGPSYSSMLVLPGVMHDDFGDFILIRWPLRAWKRTDGYATLQAINSAVLQFLDRCLNL